MSGADAINPKVIIGFLSERGPRKQNEDFVGAVVGGATPNERRDVVVAIADGIGGVKGGRIAAETVVRGFLDGLWDVPETMDVRRAGANILDALNRWIHAQGHQDPTLAGMGTTFTGLVLRGRMAHLLHVGDTRAYRLGGDRLTRLTNDHSRHGPGGQRLLYRAVGIEPELRLDYAVQPMALYDRFLLCSDGLHDFVEEGRIADILRARASPAEASRELVEAAFAAGGADNCSALVLDVVGLPAAQRADVSEALLRLPVIEAPRVGDTVDGFALKAMMSDGPYSRAFAALDEIEGGEVAIKFPKPRVAAEAAHHLAFVREAWVGERITSPWIAHILAQPQGRQTCLYNVMPLYHGELLERRLARRPAIALEDLRNIAIKLAHALAALHRASVIHRDVKPDNVLLEPGGSLKLLDLGVVRLPGFEEADPAEIPGTVAYMAPEMLKGDAGDEATDVYALGVTLFRALTGDFPYGNLDSVSPPRLDRAKDIMMLRPDLPAWVASAIGRAIARDRSERFGNALAFADEMEAGPSAVAPIDRRPPTFYERHRLRFWQGLAGVLAAALALVLLLR